MCVCVCLRVCISVLPKLLIILKQHELQFLVIPGWNYFPSNLKRTTNPDFLFSWLVNRFIYSQTFFSCISQQLLSVYYNGISPIHRLLRLLCLLENCACPLDSQINVEPFAHNNIRRLMKYRSVLCNFHLFDYAWLEFVLTIQTFLVESGRNKSTSPG